MGRDEETPNRGMFGYEGEGFDVTRDTDGEPEPEPAPREQGAERGWNIGREDDAPKTTEE